MDNHRQIQGQDYGILRKKDGKEEELFVFGYSCKIYEDYDKSLYVDQGKHLIPWLGDETLKIDRYDCRGALSDLTPYLPKSEGFDRRAGLSNEEKRIESLCDQERFRALTVNEDEILHQEEELKRLQMAINAENSYNEVGFSYDNDSKNNQESTLKESNEDDDDEPFIPPYQLDVPVGMKIPKSKKHHEIIEKTAFFINEQGIQMEILLKMKQADNPQFNFLSFDNDLHPYYRHMLNAIKSQRYKQTQPFAATETVQETAQEENYLHPALALSTSFSLPESAPKIPTISYKSSENCLYSALVNRIKESQNSRFDLISVEDQKKKEHIGLENPVYDPSIGLNSSFDPNDENSKSSDFLPLSALTKSARRRRIRKEKSKAAVASFKIYYTEEKVSVPVEESPSSDNLVDEVPATETEPVEKVRTLKPIPAPAPIIEVPPTEMQLIIDKMASYVAKNGRSFEDVVRAKGDSRFSFLDHAHVHNPYYNQKVQLYLQLEYANKLSSSELSQTELSKMNPTIKKSNFKSKQTKQPNPICFAIKKPKDQEMLEIKSALPGEESEIEEAERTDQNIEIEDEERIDGKVSPVSVPSSPPLTTSDMDPITELVTEVTSPTKKMNDAMMEKWDQERIKAKLFTAAKEKLAAKAREKDAQLQAERRKKAMEFINLLQKDSRTQANDSTSTEAATFTSNGKIDEKDVITIPSESSTTDSDSVISVPFGGEEEEDKTKGSKREYCDNDDVQEKTGKRRDYSVEKNKHRKSKHRGRTKSPSYSRHSHKKYDKNDRKRRKRKHHHRRSRSPTYRKPAHKTSYKHKRSKYSDDDSSCSSNPERY